MPLIEGALDFVEVIPTHERSLSHPLVGLWVVLADAEEGFHGTHEHHGALRLFTDLVRILVRLEVRNIRVS